MHHVSEEEGLSCFATFELGDVWQKFLLKNFLCVFGASLACAGLVAAFSDEIKSDCLILDWESFVETWFQHFQHLSIVPIVANVIEDVFIGDDAKATEVA